MRCGLTYVIAAALLLTGPARLHAEGSESIAVVEIPTPAGNGSAQPHLAVAPDGTVVLSWLEPTHDGHRLLFARLEDDGWSAAQTVVRGSEWFVNWADFPSVVPITNELWAAHWLAKSADATYAYDVMLSVSHDGGETWSSPFSPHADGTPTEHGFVTLFPWRDAIGVVWLDGRNMVGDHGGHAGGMTLRSAMIGPRGERLDENLVDGLVCDCCQTDVVITDTGPLAAYRDRSEEEVRDISLARATGDGWEDPVSLHADGWRIAGCPVNGPAMSASGPQVDIAWFTAADSPAIRFARSLDEGRKFSEPVTIDEQMGDRVPLGRVDVVTLPDGSSIVSWVASAGVAQGKLTLRRIESDGTVSASRLSLFEPEPSRQVGFPQMVRDGPDLVVAWTAAEGDRHRVHTVRLTGRR